MTDYEKAVGGPCGIWGDIIKPPLIFWGKDREALY